MMCWLFPLYQAHTIMILANFTGQYHQHLFTLTSSGFLGNRGFLIGLHQSHNYSRFIKVSRELLKVRPYITKHKCVRIISLKFFYNDTRDRYKIETSDSLRIHIR